VIERSHDVVIVGAGAAGRCVAAEMVEHGITDFTILDVEVISSVFDDDTDSWTLTTRGETCHGGVVIACESPLVPWIPNLPGCNDFRGLSFHAAACDPDFDPASQRIAVVGSDAAAGQLIARMATSGASIKVFPLPPRRVIAQPRRGRRYLRRQAELVTSPLETLTPKGIRTSDGSHHDADAIVYGTGFAIPARLANAALVGVRGLTLQQAWHDGMEPYLGGTIHGFPNYFMASGPEFGPAMRYIAQCLTLMQHNPSTRIEVRRSTQQVFNERVHLRRPSHRLVASAFDLSSVGVHDDAYEGAATLTLANTSRPVRVRLTGHIDPIDGQYHWQGTVFERLPADLLAQGRTVDLAVGERSAAARITEETPQGTHSITGVGVPPFALAEAELRVAQL
jgi:cation diffusion facilitator CzcD-associated flavoprotein CzcO